MNCNIEKSNQDYHIAIYNACILFNCIDTKFKVYD